MGCSYTSYHWGFYENFTMYPEGESWWRWGGSQTVINAGTQRQKGEVMEQKLLLRL